MGFCHGVSLIKYTKQYSTNYDFDLRTCIMVIVHILSSTRYQARPGLTGIENQIRELIWWVPVKSSSTQNDHCSVNRQTVACCSLLNAFTVNLSHHLAPILQAWPISPWLSRQSVCTKSAVVVPLSSQLICSSCASLSSSVPVAQVSPLSDGNPNTHPL